MKDECPDAFLNESLVPFRAVGSEECDEGNRVNVFLQGDLDHFAFAFDFVKDTFL